MTVLVSASPCPASGLPPGASVMTSALASGHLLGFARLAVADKSVCLVVRFCTEKLHVLPVTEMGH